MDFGLLQELKRHLLKDESLANVWSYFMDHFADHAEFSDQSEHTRHPFVEAVLAQLSQQLFGADGTLSDVILKQVAERQFVHGGYLMGGRIGGVIYFEDEHTGLVAVSERHPSIQVKYARFSGRRMRGTSEPSRN